jgi:hypothetical protein
MLKIKRRCFAAAASLFALTALPEVSRAGLIYGTWTGNSSGYYEQTQGNNILSYETFSEPATLSFTFTTYGNSFYGSYVVFVGYVPFELTGDGTIGYQGALWSQYNGGEGSYGFTIDLSYNSIGSNGEVVYNYLPGAAVATFISVVASSNSNGPVENTDFVSFVSAAPEPSSIVLTGSAALIGLIVASIRRFQSVREPSRFRTRPTAR